MSTQCCSICGNTARNKLINVREMMFGLRESFPYLECSACGCVQLAEVPSQMATYYPEDYFPTGVGYAGRSGLRRFLRSHRARYCLKQFDALGWMLVRVFGEPSSSIFGRPKHYRWFARCNLTFSSRILDVGCGPGGLLAELHEDGFTDLTGVDPYLQDSITYAPGFQVLKKGLDEVDTQFDLVMLHHTFEHMPDPLTVMRRLFHIIKPGGHCIIRIPVAGCHAYRQYGADWVQLDAPRHLFLHTPRSIQMLARQAGLEVFKTVFDSTAFQFWGSEQYRRDIPLKDPRSYAINPGGGLFSEQQILEFEKQAEKLNQEVQGDSACFLLRRQQM